MRTNAQPLIFGLTFGGLMLAFYVLFSAPLFDQGLYHYLQANAWLSNSILRILGQKTEVSDVIIHSSSFSIAIRRGCDAVEPTWLYCSAVLAFHAPWPKKWLGILTGIVVLQALNLVRIVTLFLIGMHWPSFFNSVHMEIWPLAFILVAITLFAAWVKWSIRSLPPHAGT